MAKCVRIENERVTQTMPFPFGERGYWLRGNAQIQAELFEAPDHVEPNWRYADGVFLEPEVIADDMQEV